MYKQEITTDQIIEYFETYGFTLLRDCKLQADGSSVEYYQLLHSESDTTDTIVAEYYTDNYKEACKRFYPEALEYTKENNLKPVPKEIEVDAESDEYVVYGLSLFLRGETLEECPIEIVSREETNEEEAQLVNFVFGKAKEPCVAIVYDDGIIYTPQDWQSPVWEDEGWEIDQTEWMDCNFRPCINFNGLPRMLV